MKKTADKILDEMNKVLIGKEDVVRKLLIVLLSGGHILLEDIPGVGKTSLAKSAAIICGLDSKRIQFTPDTLPTDVTGFTMWDERTHEFRFHKGTVMTNILLADEINRTSARTQSALLQAMEENCVTEDGVTYRLEPPFSVIATQNPLGSAGTMPLPLSQTDRFMMKLSIGRPTEKELSKIIMTRHTYSESDYSPVSAVCGRTAFLELMSEVSDIYISEAMCDWMAKLIEATHHNENIRCGASPRAAVQLSRAAKAAAFLRGGSFVSPEDAAFVFTDVIAHRLVIAAGSDSAALCRDILKANKPPHLKGGA